MQGYPHGFNNLRLICRRWKRNCKSLAGNRRVMWSWLPGSSILPEQTSDRKTVTPTIASNSIARLDWSLNIQIFLYLQLLDVVTTWLGFRMGLGEASPFIQFLMRMGPLVGLLASKVVAVGMGAFCV